MISFLVLSQAELQHAFSTRIMEPIWLNSGTRGYFNMEFLMKLNSRFLRYFGHPQKFFSDEKILNFLGVKSGINHFEYKVVIQ